MKQAMWKKWVCAGLLASAAFFSGCGSEDKVAVVDYQRLEAESPRIQSIEKEIGTKNQEISDRLAKEQSSLSQEDYQKKAAAAQQERQIFMQSKQKQVQSLIESQAGAIAKEKQIGIVMHKGSVPFGSVDITDEVLSRINSSASQSQTASSKAQ